MKSYLEFIELLKEGLITTHDITKYHGYIERFLHDHNIKFKLKIENKLLFNIELFTDDKIIIDMINHHSYTIGYFPSLYTIHLKNKMCNDFKKIDDINFTNNILCINISYEAKYDDGLYTNNIICPDKLYHLTPTKNWDSILKKGIYPKSKKRLSNHPERIYLFTDINDTSDLLNNLKSSDKIKGIYQNYDLIEIDSCDDKLILHTDPNYLLGYFTYDNISPSIIKRIQVNI